MKIQGYKPLLQGFIKPLLLRIRVIREFY